MKCLEFYIINMYNMYMKNKNNAISEMFDKAKYAVTVLQNHSYQAVYAGGCVRDMILQVPCNDVDIATSATPEQVMELFKRYIPVGINFGFVRVLIDDVEFEIATFRKDSKNSDGRRPSSVEFCDMQQDAMRRDFTINGLFYDPITCKIHDFVGGMEDISNNIVRFIRFSDRFGKFDTDSFEAVKKHSIKINQVSNERIQQELCKCFIQDNGKYASKSILLMRNSGILSIILPEVSKLVGVVQDPKYHPEGDAFVHTMCVLDSISSKCKCGCEVSIELMLSGLLHDIGKPYCTVINHETGRVSSKGHAEIGSRLTEQVMKRLKFSNDITDYVVDLVKDHMKLIGICEMSKSTRKKLFAKPYFNDLFMLHKCDKDNGRNEIFSKDIVKSIQKYLDEYSSEPAMPKPFISGSDIINICSVLQGKDIGCMF